MNGQVDRSWRALITLTLRADEQSEPFAVTAWVDTAFTGELVIPRQQIEQLQLQHSSAILAGLADGKQVVLDTFSCRVDWFDEERLVEVVESDGDLALLGVGLLRGHRLEIDYRFQTLSIK